jgi:cyclase
MLRARLIPCLLVKDGALVKTIGFDQPTYVGDPLNTVKIFNEKMVDELIVADIGATASRQEPDFSMIQSLAAQCRMPLCYAGGVNTIGHVERIISLGVEKVALGNAANVTPDLVNEAAKRLGSQSVVVVLDVKKSATGKGFDVYTHNGKKHTGRNAVSFAKEMESKGAGELLINSIDNDGAMTGYDYVLINEIYSAVNLPMTVLGGAANISNCAELFRKFGIIGAAAGSIFVFKGKFKAVLIQYPTVDEKLELFKK